MLLKGQSGESAVGGIIGIIVLVLVVWWGYNTFFKTDTWMAIYEVSTSQMAGTRDFDSKNDCLNWIHDQQMFPGARYNFECGSNCKYSGEYAAYRCKETFD